MAVWNRQSGSAAAVAMAALAALSMTALFVNSNLEKTNQVLQKARVNDAREIGDAVNLSNLSTFKALMSDRRVAGQYESALYAANYFAPQWKLFKNSSLVMPHVDVLQDKVSVSFLSTESTSSTEFLDVLKNEASVLSKFKQSYLLQIIKLHADPLHPYYIDAIDVRAEANVIGKHANTAKRTESIGRIALRAPVPKSLSLWIKGPNQTNFSQNLGISGSGLPAGDYVFQVRASGVVHYAELNLDGQTFVLGIDPNTGAITHGANNRMADQVVVGEVVKSIAPTSAATAGTAGWQSCEIAVTNTVGGSGTVGVSIRVAAYGVDGTEASDLSLAKTLYIASAQQTIAAGPGEVACQDACPLRYLEDVAEVPDGLLQHLDKGIAGVTDKRQLDTSEVIQTAQLVKNGGTGLICSNHELLGEALYQVSGMLPSKFYASNNQLFNAQIGENLHLKHYVAYLAPKCERQLIGKRDKCGCFAADTRIRMADGTDRPIHLIRQGDLVWNPRLQKSSVVAQVIAGPEKYPLLSIKTAESVLEVTGEHPFLTPSGLRKAHQLRAHDIIIDGSRAVEVLAVVANPPGDVPPTVWNLSLASLAGGDDEHFVLANGVMTGDLYLQAQLGKKAMVADDH